MFRMAAAGARLAPADADDLSLDGSPAALAPRDSVGAPHREDQFEASAPSERVVRQGHELSIEPPEPGWPTGFGPGVVYMDFTPRPRPSAAASVAPSAHAQPATGVTDDLTLTALSGAAEFARVGVSDVLFVSGLGQRRRPEPDSLAFVLAAEAGLKLSHRARFAVGYEFFRASDSGDSAFADTLDKGLFAQLRLEF